MRATEGLRVGCGGKNKVFIKPLALVWAEGEGLGFGSTSIRSTIVTGQTEGLKGWLRRDGWFAKVDNRFGYEKWLQGGSIGLVSLI